MIPHAFKILFLLFCILSGTSGMLVADGERVLPGLDDVKDVFGQGDSTLMGMRIESSYFADGSFLIETTGARFEYVQGCLKLYQGLDEVDRRLLAEVEFDNDPNFVKVKSTPDHVLFMSPTMNIGIYGDSTLILSPKIKQPLKFTGHFKPDYEGRHKGELLLIDDKGGMEIYPQRYGAGYKIRQIELGKTEWIAEYVLDAGQRVMVAAFPGRPFDWEGSFKANVVTTSGLYENNSFGQKIGQMPPSNILKIWSRYFHIITVFSRGLYPNADYSGPYTIVDEKEFARFVEDAHKVGMKVLPYVSFFYFERKFRSKDLLFSQIESMKNEFDIDGVYIDGAYVDIHNADRVFQFEDKIASWEMVRRFRELFGEEGVIMLHATHQGSPVGTVPNIDSNCNIMLNGEAVPFESFEDEYIRYHVRKKGVSNAIAMWKFGKRPENITYEKKIDFLLSIDGRHRWGGYPWYRERPVPGASNKEEVFYWWPTDYTRAKYDYYLDQLDKIKKMR